MVLVAWEGIVLSEVLKRLAFQTLNKAYGVDVPLVLMNSFNTEEDTKKVLKKYANVKVGRGIHGICSLIFLLLSCLRANAFCVHGTNFSLLLIS